MNQPQMIRLQSQRSLTDQIEDLKAVAHDSGFNVIAPISDRHALRLAKLANHLGLYDAADFIMDQLGSDSVTLGEL